MAEAEVWAAPEVEEPPVVLAVEEAAKEQGVREPAEAAEEEPRFLVPSCKLPK